MDVEHLSEAAIFNECLVRDYEGPPTNRASWLKEQLKLEQTKDISPPNRPHQSARKNPRREFKYCSTELLKIKGILKNCVEDPNAYQNVINRLYAQTSHFIARLRRMEYSSCVREDTIKLINEATILQNLLDKCLLHS